MPEAIATQPQSHLIRALSSAGRMPNPLPLLTTNYDVQIHGGLAIVTEHRQFQNNEEQSVEATLTFPIPVHAVLHHLSAKIGSRTLIARAKRNDIARNDYEEAIDRGKFSVLHEEVLRGVHMLSVGHLPPKQNTSITSRWCMSLAWIDDQAQLRIPVTVGDIYGETPLSDADDLITDGPVLEGQITVRAATAATVNGIHTTQEPLPVTLDRPLNIVLPNWQPEDITGTSADGRQVALAIEPCNSSETTVEAAILVDHSGSMSEAVDPHSLGITVHEAVCNGLRSAAQRVPECSQIELWEFDTQVDYVGSANDTRSLQQVVDQLCEPRYGTEVGKALDYLTSKTDVKDIILITDGKSHSLNVQALAQRGKRITLVLVGQDSLEANVGYLAALTGGEIFVALDGDIAPAILSAFGAVTRPQVQSKGDAQDAVSQFRSGMTVSARWSSQSSRSKNKEDVEDNAVAAFAASLAFTSLKKKGAAQLAEDEGIVSHVTSLILVDHAGKAQHGLPATRKIAAPRAASSYAKYDTTALTAARTAALCASHAPRECASAARPPAQKKFSHGRSKSVVIARSRSRIRAKAAQSPADKFNLLMRRLLAIHKGTIDWTLAAQLIVTGDLSILPAKLAESIKVASREPQLEAMAKQLNIDPVTLTVGLLAKLEASSDRSAERVARRIFGGKTEAEIDQMVIDIGG